MAIEAMEQLFTEDIASRQRIFSVLDNGLVHALEEIDNSPKRGDDLYSADFALYTMLKEGKAEDADDLWPEFLNNENLDPELKEWWCEWIVGRYDEINAVLQANRADKSVKQ